MKSLLLPVTLAIAMVALLGSANQADALRVRPGANCTFFAAPPHLMPSINGQGVRVHVKCTGDMRAVPAFFTVVACSYVFKGGAQVFVSCSPPTSVPVLRGPLVGKGTKVLKIGGICQKRPKLRQYTSSITVVHSWNARTNFRRNNTLRSTMKCRR